MLLFLNIYQKVYLIFDEIIYLSLEGANISARSPNKVIDSTPSEDSTSPKVRRGRKRKYPVKTITSNSLIVKSVSNISTQTDISGNLITHKDTESTNNVEEQKLVVLDNVDSGSVPIVRMKTNSDGKQVYKLVTNLYHNKPELRTEKQAPLPPVTIDHSPHVVTQVVPQHIAQNQLQPTPHQPIIIQQIPQPEVEMKAEKLLYGSQLQHLDIQHTSQPQQVNTLHTLQSIEQELPVLIQHGQMITLNQPIQQVSHVGSNDITSLAVSSDNNIPVSPLRVIQSDNSPLINTVSIVNTDNGLQDSNVEMVVHAYPHVIFN